MCSPPKWSYLEINIDNTEIKSWRKLFRGMAQIIDIIKRLWLRSSLVRVGTWECCVGYVASVYEIRIATILLN